VSAPVAKDLTYAWIFDLVAPRFNFRFVAGQSRFQAPGFPEHFSSFGGRVFSFRVNSIVKEFTEGNTCGFVSVCRVDLYGFAEKLGRQT